MYRRYAGFTSPLVLFILSISTVGVFMFGERGGASQLIHHHIHHLCQLKSLDEVNNYQIVALTTLWSFLAHEVAQNLILKDLNVRGKRIGIMKG